MLIDKFIQAIKPKDVKVILDIGSRDLEQSEELHSVFPDAKIYAFEPNPDSTALMKPGEYLTLTPKAVMDYDGEITFHKVKHEDNHGASSIFEPTEFVVGVDRVNGLEKITVPCTRIDTWAEINGIEKIDLVWMDVQGAELPVLNSFGSLLDNVQAIATEAETGPLYFPNRKYQPTQYLELREFLEAKGFEEVARDQPWALETDVVYVKR